MTTARKKPAVADTSPTAPGMQGAVALRHDRADRLDNHVLQGMVGYNTRRASSMFSSVFAERIAPYGLKQVDFSVLSLLGHNPGATSLQLCSTLDILPPNMADLVATMDSLGLIERRPHPRAGRAVGLHLTPAGAELVREAEQAVVHFDLDGSARLTPREREMIRARPARRPRACCRSPPVRGKPAL